VVAPGAAGRRNTEGRAKEGRTVIRATFETPQGPIVFLGVTTENVRRLKTGQPIDVDLKPLIRGQIPARVVIAYGETHVEIVETIEHAMAVPAEFKAQAAALDAELT
jgi:hypothetical protein